MNTFKSHFVYDRQKRSGILILLVCIILGLTGVVLYEPTTSSIVHSEVDREELLAFEQRIDSLREIALEARKPKMYPFNPNFITDYKGYTLGMSTEEIDRLVRFRESGKWINSVADFKRVTQVSDALLAVIAPYFKFPDWVTNPKPRKSYPSKRTWKTDEEKGDLNALKLEDLMGIEGMDAVSADKFLKYRTKIGGFLIKNQVYDIYGVTTEVKRAILNAYTVKEIPEVSLMDVNTATASDLATIPKMSFELAKEIVDYRTLREGVQSLEELAKIDGMTDSKFARIRLYLKID